VRILVVANLYPPLVEGGAELATRRQVAQLRDAGHTVAVLTTDGTIGLRPVPRPRAGMPCVLETPSPNIYHILSRPTHRWKRPVWAAFDLFNPISARLVAQVCNRVRPDVVITSNLWNLSTSVWRPLAHRAPVIHVLHDGSTVCQTGVFNHGGFDCFGTLQPCRAMLAVRRRQSAVVGTLLAPSRFLLGATAEAGLFRRARTAYVPNPAPSLPAIVDRAGRRGPLAVAFVGNIERYKGFDIVVGGCVTDAVATLHVVGSGDEELISDARTRLGDRLVLHGRVPPEQVAKVLAASDALVMASICHENLPSVVLEGQAAGLTVISTRSGGTVEVVTDGVDGLLIERGSTDQLRAALERLVADPELRLRLGAGGRAIAERRAVRQDCFVATVESTGAHQRSHF